MEEEYLDIVDENDNVLRQQTRTSVYKNGLKSGESYRVVNILIFNSEGKLLLPLRSNNRRLFPDCYDFSCAEHVEAGETYHEAARRGLSEELGRNDMKIKLLGKLGPKEGVSSFQETYMIVFDGEFPKYDKNGIKSLQWFSVEKILLNSNQISQWFLIGSWHSILNSEKEFLKETILMCESIH